MPASSEITNKQEDTIMAQRKNKQFAIYPDPIAAATVGGNIPALNLAIESWAIVLRNSQPELSRAEWNFLADVLNGSFDGDLALGMHQHGASALALEVHDAQALDGTGDKWFGDATQRGSGQAAADELERKIAAMSWEQIRAIRTATNFFWSRAGIEAIDFQEDEWWTIEYRVRLLREGKPAAKSRTAGGKRRKA